MPQSALVRFHIISCRDLTPIIIDTIAAKLTVEVFR